MIKKLPTVGIICSPAPLGIVGILTIEENPNIFMLLWLIVTGLILLVVVYSYIWRLFKEGFKPAYASFTFLLAIATMAAYDLGKYFTDLGYNFGGHNFKVLSDMEIFIATYVIFFILLNFVNMFIKAMNPRIAEELVEDENILHICYIYRRKCNIIISFRRRKV